MSQLQQLQANPQLDDQDRFLHLKEIFVNFVERRPNSDLRIKFKDKSGFETKSDVFKKADSIHWKADIYVKWSTEAVLTIRNAFFNNSIAEIPLTFNPDEFGENKTVERKDTKSGASVYMIFAMSKSSDDVARLLGTQACSALAAKVSMLEKLDKVLDFLDILKVGASAAEVNTHAKIAVGVVSQALAKFREITTCHKQLVAIMNDLVSILPVMKAALERIQDAECRQLLRSFVSFVKETSEGLIRYASRSTIELIVLNWYKSKKDDVGRLKDQSMRLKQNLGLALSFDIQKEISEIQGSTSEIQKSTSETQLSTSEIRQRQLNDADEKILERIKPPRLSSFDPDHCCMSGTRAFLLQNIESFALSDNQSSRLYWLFGIAGSGKSSISASVAFALHNQERLSGSFFCKRDVPELRNPINLIRTLAYSIARVSVPYRTLLLDVLKEDPGIEDKALKLQFEALLAGPFYKVSQCPPHEPIIIVVDALDECDDNKSVSLFLAQMIMLAPWLRFIVTSRPLPDIKKGLQVSEGLVAQCDLFTQDADDDILSFIRWHFSPQGPLMELQAYVTDAQILALGRKSFGLFIWIATVLSYVNGLMFGKLDAIEDILCSGNASNPEAELDGLYLRVLRSVVGSSAANKKAVKLIVGLIYVTSRNRPLPARALHAFISGAGIRVLPQELESVLRQLGSILTTDSQTDAIRVCHPSFLDFIGSEPRSGNFWTETAKLDTIMAKKCFDIMDTGLRFNMCQLESSYLANADVDDLKERVARCIPQELQYSCFYWLDHLSKSEDQRRREVGEMLHSFLCEKRSLYWLEALSLMSELKAANMILQKLRAVYKDDTKLCNAALDFYRFVTGLHEPMSRSTPHIYISALLWAPSESTITKSHGCKFKNSQQVLAGRNASWPVSLQTLLTESEVSCVQYSPNGSRTISGSSDYTIRMWDAESGTPVGEPLRGHTGEVWSVGYSPDGSRIISGSFDKTIRMWDAESGGPIGEPLRGHSGGVNSVGYSPDGTRIISGSWDDTIRMWDAESGAPVGGPLQGHTGRVSSVGYSPDGRRIISGSFDKTIRMWDAESGAPVGEPLRDHTDGVNSVGYSRDGTRIISGSDDSTIRIWDAESGGPVGKPLRGHTDRVLSVEYSPDGSRIISGSFDKTIRMWGAESGAPIGELLRGHTGWVFSVGYSPDGSRIISGSFDNTIRIWDAESGGPIGEPLRGHTSWVNSVGYSPDGSRIISGSLDKTIRMWDAESGAPVGEPLRDHTGGVNSVGYSPDGTRIISGSSDKTIRMWDAESGAPVGEPLRDHTGGVNSVGYSPDGNRIISGSSDKTIRMWDAESGAPVGEPLRGHTGRVRSVGYSPDGTRIISGSFDKTIRIWDAESGAPVGKPLRGYMGRVNSVMYSPDGTRIISGSWDDTIRMWDAESGVPIGEPFRGHKGLVCSVGYSPDGSRIISGSEDKTIRMWDAESGAPVGEPLRGHTGRVSSFGYSPDGSRIISGSWDDTIRMWDAESGAPVGEPLRGHTGRVSSVGYSPDGSRIISGSWDDTIRMWDAESGAPVGEPLRGHTSEVWSVGYSPDGTRIISGSDDKTVRMWDAESGAPVGKLPQGGIHWSPGDECFVSISEINASDEETRVAYSTIPSSIPLDGWIRTLDGGLLLWVPHEYRNGVCDMSLASMPYDADGHPVKIDWKSLYRAWTDLRNEEKA